MSAAARRLVFVYNADTGLLEAVQHVVWAAARPATYPCRLCLLTYGPLGMRRPWRRFIASLPTPSDFLHADELQARYPALGPVELPALFEDVGGSLTPLIDAVDMREMASLDALITRVRALA